MLTLILLCLQPAMSAEWDTASIVAADTTAVIGASRAPACLPARRPTPVLATHAVRVNWQRSHRHHHRQFRRQQDWFSSASSASKGGDGKKF